MSHRELRHNLSVRLTSLVGREREIAEGARLLSEARLLTLGGAPGVGKTRLALEIGARLLDRYPDGIWFVELASLADPRLVPRAVAAALGVAEQPRRPLAETLVDHLGSKRLLLILDNCEHLVLACAALSETLPRSCPRLSILATSREPLAVEGETTWRVPSLSYPDPTNVAPLEGLARSESVRLFGDRAAAVRPGFAVTERNARAMAQICTRLDGIPLALELAAAWVNVLAVEQIATRLDDSLRLLAGGARTAMPRQQTLRSAIEWSHALLAESERVLLRRLSVFAGGWALEGAEGVCAGDGLDAGDVLDLLAGLIDKSLVVEEERGDEARYRLLETIRQYGLERLEASGEAAEVRCRHWEYYRALAERADAAYGGPEQAEWHRRLETEHDNLRMALVWSAEAQDDPDLLAWLAVPLWRFWWKRGHLSEARRWLDRALARATEPAARIKALGGAANLAFFQDDYPRARELWTEAAALGRAHGDRGSVAGALGGLAYVARIAGEHDRAAALSEESLALSRQLGDTVRVAQSLHACALAAYGQGDLDGAAAAWEESLRLHREVGRVEFVPHLLHSLARLALARHELAKATALCEEAIELFGQQEDKHGLHFGLITLMLVAERRGEVERVVGLAEEVLALGRELGSRTAVANILERLARVARARGDPGLAARLLGAAEALREALGQTPSIAERGDYEAQLAAVLEALGEEAFAAAWAEGRAMPPERATEQALAVPSVAARLADTSPAGQASPLSSREEEVAALVARGLTNRQIAAELVVSERTVDAHVRGILGKLGFSSRARVAAWAVERGLVADTPWRPG